MIEIIVIALLIGIDQFVKYLTVTHLKDQASHVLIEGVFQLTYVENRGAAFGMLQNQRVFFLIFTLLVTAGICYFLYKMPRNKHYLMMRLVVVIFIAGALGNWIDRMRLSYVIDTFYFSLIDFPVFNVADMYVVISTFLFAFLILFVYKDHDFEFIKKNRPKDGN